MNNIKSLKKELKENGFGIYYQDSTVTIYNWRGWVEHKKFAYVWVYPNGEFELRLRKNKNQTVIASCKQGDNLSDAMRKLSFPPLRSVK